MRNGYSQETYQNVSVFKTLTDIWWWIGTVLGVLAFLKLIVSHSHFELGSYFSVTLDAYRAATYWLYDAIADWMKIEIPEILRDISTLYLVLGAAMGRSGILIMHDLRSGRRRRRPRRHRHDQYIEAWEDKPARSKIFFKSLLFWPYYLCIAAAGWVLRLFRPDAEVLEVFGAKLFPRNVARNLQIMLFNIFAVVSCTALVLYLNAIV